MKEWESVDEVLDFAIGNEQKAVDFYTDLANRAENQAIRAVFEGFAREEEGHREKLRGLKASGGMAVGRDKIADLKITDYLIDVDPSDDLDYQKSLILAMKREKAAFKLYTDLAAMAPNAELKRTFHALAQEEAKHKLRFEIEYDEQILSEN